MEIQSNLWCVASVHDEPEIALRSWRIFEATYVDASEPATRHFVGCCVDRLTGRVSTAIRSFDFEKRRGRTESGRVYELRGKPGTSVDADCVWQAWAEINAVGTWRDVTGEVFASGAAFPVISIQ